MSVLIYIIPIALIIGLAGLAAFLWALKNDQFEDLEGAACRILNDDDDNTNEINEKKSTNQETSKDQL